MRGVLMELEKLRELVKESVSSYFDVQLGEAEEQRIASMRISEEYDDDEYEDDEEEDSSDEQEEDPENDSEKEED